MVQLLPDVFIQIQRIMTVFRDDVMFRASLSMTEVFEYTTWSQVEQGQVMVNLGGSLIMNMWMDFFNELMNDWMTEWAIAWKWLWEGMLGNKYSYACFQCSRDAPIVDQPSN